MAEVKELYESLTESFTEDYISNLGLLLREQARSYYEKHNLEGKVYFEDEIFSSCLIDILVDIARLKDFHDIKDINYTKLAAYSSSWILKRKPFQMIQGCGKNYLYTNERFVLYMLVQASGLVDNGYYRENEEQLKQNIKQLFYHLKYRNTNPQTLELLLVGIGMGMDTHRN